MNVISPRRLTKPPEVASVSVLLIPPNLTFVLGGSALLTVKRVVVLLAAVTFPLKITVPSKVLFGAPPVDEFNANAPTVVAAETVTSPFTV